MISLKELGRRCRRFRMSQGYIQMQVAEETGYSKENVSAFETGRNDNSRILLWYMLHGLTIDDLRGL